MSLTLELLEERLRGRRLRVTSQRRRIAQVFFAMGGHVSVEALARRVKRADPAIGVATVYRTMRLLADMGLASERHFTDGRAVFEPAPGRHHHDHMICERCGTVIEFENERIERLQERMARKHGFTMTRHRLELFGLCRRCSRSGRTAPAAGRDRG